VSWRLPLTTPALMGSSLSLAAGAAACGQSLCDDRDEAMFIRSDSRLATSVAKSGSVGAGIYPQASLTSR
jgi:hypothetical protein